MTNTETTISNILQYSGLGFSNLEHTLANALVEEGDEATHQRVIGKIKAGIEAIERESRMSSHVVRHERCVAILTKAVA